MIDFSKIPSPCFVLDERALRRNLAVIDRVRQESGAEVIVALKACAMWSIFPELARHSDGATASSLNEARLVAEEYGARAHTYAPAYSDAEFEGILQYSSHITFNSAGQFERFGAKAILRGISCGLRINPGWSSVETDLYNPALPGSRLGIERLKRLPEGVDAIDHRRQAYPSVYTDVVFYTPEQESYRAQGDVPVAGKRRHISADLYVNFPQNVPDIRLDFRSNFDELRKADSLMNYIMSNDNVSEVEVSVHGYASPEGALWRNRNLARYRALNVKKYLDGRFDLSSLPLRVEWTPVDWAGLREILSTGDFPLADEIVAIIDGTEGDQERERIISSVLGRDLHRRLVAEVYPRLRRTVVRADFTVPPFTPEESRELIDSEPELMSLEEMYSAAGLYEEGSYEHTEIYLRAARQFPDDFIANNNAAAALLRSGNSREAYKYLIKISSDPRAYSNTGIYYYLEGDIEKAKEYFRMAMDAGTPGAEKRLKMIEGNSDR